MSLWKIAWRSLEQRPLASVLTCLSMALGVALVVAVLVTHSVVSDYFTRNTSLGYHFIVGGKNGSKLELVLSCVYHIGIPDEPIPWSYYKKFIVSTDKNGQPQPGQFASRVKLAAPICLGDNYQGYRVLATTPEFFDFEFETGHGYEFAEGERFQSKNFFHAVIGAEVARKTGLALGDTFQPTHSITEEGDAHIHHDEFTVVGILKPTGTPNDRVLLINVEGFYLLEHHAKEVEPAKKQAGVGSLFQTAAIDFDRSFRPDGGLKKTPDPFSLVAHAQEHPAHDHHHHHHDHPRDPLPESQREVTAILVRCQTIEGPVPGLSAGADYEAGVLVREINEGNEAQAAQPSPVIFNLMTKLVTPMQWILLGLTILTVIVAGIGIMVSIYNSMAGRRHEIAVMRALGASRQTVMIVVLLESILLAVAGGIIGMLLGHGIVAAASPLLAEYAGISVGLGYIDRYELLVLPILIVLAAVVGYVPALTAYRTDVVKGLSATG
jgi:putative ABC transport system permease protein